MGARLVRLGSPVVFAVLALSALTTVYDPLGDLPIGLGVALVLAPVLGLGLAVARWWAPAVPLALAVPWALRGGDTGNAFSARLEAGDLIALGIGAAAVSLAGVLLATSDTGRLAAARRLAPAAGLALLAVAAVPLAWAGVRHARPLDRAGDGVAVAADRGTVGEIGLGSEPREVMRVLGRVPTSETAPVAPLGDDFASIGAPPLIETPGESHAVMRYDDVSFLVSDGLVYGVVVTAAGAETEAGVGVGDNLEVASSAYPDLHCRTEVGENGRTFPRCSGRIAAGRWAWFGDDPIRSITLASTAL